MPVTKLLGGSTPDAMKSDEGTDSLDTFIRHAVGKEPLFSFSRTGDNPLQWIQFLHTMDQPDLPGWPLLAPMKVQMQKCDKCAREFCSSINYRRHIRVHRRSMNLHKDPRKYRDLLGAFWDKLSYDEAKEIMSFKDVNLEEVPGSSIVKNIAVNSRKPLFLSLPQAYVKAGSALVDIIHARPSRLPISSQELFSVLDDASERTFLCAGTAESLQKYVFDGEVGKIGLENKNSIACTSFLFEQKLVKAWLADKEAEALRCQKLLVEEEETAQRRQAELLERKRRRKIRQKEQRARAQSNGMKVDLYVDSDMFENIQSAESSSLQISPDVVDLITPDEYAVTPLDPVQSSSNEEVVDINHSDFSATEQQRMHVNGSHHVIARWQVPKKSQRGGGRNGFHNNQNGNVIKWEHAHKHREPKVNNRKIWTKKPKAENGEEVVKSRVDNDAINQTTQSNCQLMIGSISVTVRSSARQHQANSQLEFQENGNAEIKTKSVQNGQLADRSNSQMLEEDVTSERSVDQNPSTESQQKSCDLNAVGSEDTSDSNVQVEDGVKAERTPFSIDAAKAFLSQRWKEAISGEHVELVLTSSAPEPPGQVDEAQEHMVHSVGPKGQDANVKPKFRTKPEKTIKTKYIPKQRAIY